jgi:hypothetical protein
MFSFFRRFFRRNKKVQHPLFGALVYRTNRAQNKKELPGFWEGLLSNDGSPLQLVIWGDKKTSPHPKQEALFNRMLNNIEEYIQASKEGLYVHIQAEEFRKEQNEDLFLDLNAPGVTWTLEQVYIQAYPMSVRLQDDLNQDKDGVAWGFRFKIGGLYNGDGSVTAYSAYVNLDLHPKFPFTYQ